MLNVPHRPRRALRHDRALRGAGLNLTKLEKPAPSRARTSSSCSTLDLDASVYDEDALGLLCELDEGPEAFTYLGSYSEG